MWYKSHCRKPEQLTWRQAHRWHGDKGLVNLIELLSSHTSTRKGSSPLRRGMKCGWHQNVTCTQQLWSIRNASERLFQLLALMYPSLIWASICRGTLPHSTSAEEPYSWITGCAKIRPILPVASLLYQLGFKSLVRTSIWPFMKERPPMVDLKGFFPIERVAKKYILVLFPTNKQFPLMKSFNELIFALLFGVIDF